MKNRPLAKQLAPNSAIVVSGQPKVESDFKADPPVYSQSAALDILSESYGEESVFYPAQHISIYGETQLIALRDFINQLLAEQSTPEAK